MTAFSFSDFRYESLATFCIRGRNKIGFLDVPVASSVGGCGVPASQDTFST
jgi:hypothetical protein